MTDDLPVVKSIKFVRESELTYRLRVGIHQSVDEQALREEAADRIEALEAALLSISANTCCEKCQEAALVARAALGEKKNV
jgi:hypothetical protein